MRGRVKEEAVRVRVYSVFAFQPRIKTEYYLEWKNVGQRKLNVNIL